MKVTIIFNGDNTKHGFFVNKEIHGSQDFEVTAWEVHSAYGFLELNLTDGTTQNFNLSNVFAFSVDPKK